jgi:hypothetical protein
VSMAYYLSDLLVFVQCSQLWRSVLSRFSKQNLKCMSWKPCWRLRDEKLQKHALRFRRVVSPLVTTEYILSKVDTGELHDSNGRFKWRPACMPALFCSTTR